MTRSCSDTNGQQYNRCLTLQNLHQEHHHPAGHIHSLEGPKPVTDMWSETRLSVPMFDDYYNIPYNSPAANPSSQMSLDLSVKSSKSSCRVQLGTPRRHCWPQDVTSEDGYNGDSSGSSGGSPIRGENLQTSLSSCQEGERIRERCKGRKDDSTQPDPETHNKRSQCTGDSSAVLCSHRNRGALKRQPRVEQPSQEHLQDPWVRLSEGSPESLPGIHQHHIAHSTQSVNTDCTPTTMSYEEDEAELNGTSMDVNSDPTFDMNSKSTCQIPEQRKGPPVAPKPTWFRQNLKKIRDEQDQKHRAKPAELRHAGEFNRNFGIRSASSGSSLSIKQKIHSFETFSSPQAAEKGNYRKPVAPSTSLPLVEKVVSPEPSAKSKYGIHDGIQSNKSTSVPEAELTVTRSTVQTTTEHPPSDTNHTDPDPDPVCDDQEDLQPPQTTEVDRVDVNEDVLPAVCTTTILAEEESPPEVVEEVEAESQEKPLNTTTSTGQPPESAPGRGIEEESLDKILAFGNQVSQALMRHGNPRTPQTPSSGDVTNPGESEDSAADSTDPGFSVSLAKLREFTIDQEEGASHDQAAVTSSCAQTVISAIPPQEVQRLIQEVSSLDEETLKQLVDIHVVILHKEEGAGLGFSIAGGSDLESKALTVHKVFPSGLAAQEGTIQKGDEVLSINGQTLRGVTHAEATASLRQTRGLKLAVVVINKRSEGAVSALIRRRATTTD